MKIRRKQQKNACVIQITAQVGSKYNVKWGNLRTWSFNKPQWLIETR